MKKFLAIIFCLACLFSCASVASAYSEKPIRIYDSEDIIPLEKVEMGQIIYQQGPTAEVTNLERRMDTPIILYTMTGNNLSSGTLITTITTPWLCNKSSFPSGIATFGSRLNSKDTTGEVKVGLCRVNSSGDYVADVYAYVPANGSVTKYISTADMNADSTYYGFINNTSANITSGTVAIGYLK